MKLTSDTIFAFNRASYNILHKDRLPRKESEPYVEILEKVKQEVGDNFDLRDAQSLCLMGFFVSHKNFDSYESMHAYNGQIYYEDGACLSTSGLLNNPFEWMEEGWFIKATPDKVDFDKLREMHEGCGGMTLQGKTYEDCMLIEPKPEELDWYDDVIRCYYNKNELLFQKTNELIVELNDIISKKSRKAIVLWSLSLANDVRSRLSKAAFSDRRPKDAIDRATEWAFGTGSMKAAKQAIVKCHGMCKDSTISELDKYYLHAIGQACSTVHTPKHAMGLPMYELTAIAKMNNVSNCKDAILQRRDVYLERMEFCEGEVHKYAKWAGFMSK